jgi:hypothetical protein
VRVRVRVRVRVCVYLRWARCLALFLGASEHVNSGRQWLREWRLRRRGCVWWKGNDINGWPVSRERERGSGQCEMQSVTQRDWEHTPCSQQPLNPGSAQRIVRGLTVKGA